jgi:hypothetical protein
MYAEMAFHELFLLALVNEPDSSMKIFTVLLVYVRVTRTPPILVERGGDGAGLCACLGI